MDGGDTGLPARPRTRPDCAGGPRPCPWVSCEHHALLARLALGNGMAPASDDAAVALLEELPVSCVLDVVDAEPDGAILDVVGSVLVWAPESWVRRVLSRIPADTEAVRVALDPERVTAVLGDDHWTVMVREPAVAFDDIASLARTPMGTVTVARAELLDAVHAARAIGADGVIAEIDAGEGQLIVAAPDLAATVVHLSGVLARVTAERNAYAELRRARGEYEALDDEADMALAFGLDGGIFARRDEAWAKLLRAENALLSLLGGKVGQR